MKNIPVIKPDSVSIVPAGCNIAFVFTRPDLMPWKRIRPLVQRRADFVAYNPDKTAVYVGFIVTPTNWRKVADIVHRVYNMRDVYVNIPGTDIETMNDVSPWIHCWLESFAFQNKDVYCSVPNYDPVLYTGMVGWRDYLDKPVSEHEFRLTLPCKCAWPKNMSPDKPEMFQQLCLDAARTKGCDRCPLFDMSRFARSQYLYGERTRPSLLRRLFHKKDK